MHSYIINQQCANSKLFAKLGKRSEVEDSRELCLGKVTSTQGLQKTRWGGKRQGCLLGEEHLAPEVFYHGGAGSGREL